MKSGSAHRILQELESFRQMGSVLFIAAHPDDENTELLAYLAGGRNYRTAYLSMTRGDGGQNVLGADLDEKLGVARTQELLAARHIDGAQQFFSRAIDFGFSKNYQETLNVWNKQQVLSDIVRVIRQFRPDVLITRFSPSPGGTHGHHTASAILAMEAFKLAGDPSVFPEQKLEPWQPKRIFWNVSTFQRDKAAGADLLKIDISGEDAVSGKSFHEIAGESRAMHKTQGFDSFRLPGGSGDKRSESFQLLDGAPAAADMMEGVDTTWNRVQGGAEIGKSASDVIANFNQNDPGASLAALLKLRSQLAALPKSDSVVAEKSALLDRILQQCLGLNVQTTIAHCDVVPGEPMKLHISASIHSKTALSSPIRWVAVRCPAVNGEVKAGSELHADETRSLDLVETLPKKALLTQPYWLRAEGTRGLFAVAEPDLIGNAENAPSFPIEDVFEIDGQRLVIHDEPVQITTDAKGNEIRRRLDVIPPVSLRFLTDVVILTPGAAKQVEVEVKASRVHSAGTVHLEAPDGWKVAPANYSFDLTLVGQHARYKFTITEPGKAESAKITAVATVGGVRYDTQLQEIDYPHIPPQLLQPPARLKAVSMELATRGHKIGYIPGAGDSLPEALNQMGYEVKVLDDATLTAQDLQGLDAVVLGVRAFNVRSNISNAVPVLFAYVENGGTLICQYNRPDKLKADKIAPYDLHISADRVTDEKAAITFLAPDSQLLNTPNKITAADFDGWVQERGLYFPDKWDDHFTPVLGCNDPGEQPTRGALLVAHYGKGYYIYTGLGFFRQLPAGVPGAYRLFANMVSIGK